MNWSWEKGLSDSHLKIKLFGQATVRYELGQHSCWTEVDWGLPSCSFLVLNSLNAVRKEMKQTQPKHPLNHSPQLPTPSTGNEHTASSKGCYQAPLDPVASVCLRFSVESSTFCCAGGICDCSGSWAIERNNYKALLTSLPGKECCLF